MQPVVFRAQLNRRRIVYKTLTAIFSIFLCVSCQQRGKIASEENSTGRIVLQDAVRHFEANGDTLGIKSSRFLIDNLGQRKTQDSQKNTYDQDHLTAPFLISQVRQALLFTRCDIESGNLPLSDFLEFVLPYRLDEEPLSDWRLDCINRFQNEYLSVCEEGEITARNIAIVTNINKRLQEGSFSYSTRSLPARLLDWATLAKTRQGDCWTMSNTITYPVRALGVPTAIDFTVAWGNANGGVHSWNAIVTKQKKIIPYLGYEGMPEAFSPFRIYKNLQRLPPKIFRKVFSKAAPFGTDHSALPEHLRLTHAIDVTDQYLPVDNIRLSAGYRYKTPLFLSVFTNGDWKPIAAGSTNSGMQCFQKMATRMLYLPSLFSSRTGAIPVAYPFVIVDGKAKVFKPDYNSRIALEVKHIRSAELEALAQFGINISRQSFFRNLDAIVMNTNRQPLQTGERYSLFVWDGYWRKLAEKVKRKGKVLMFENVPSNGLYRLSGEHSTSDNRLFSFEENNQVWW